MGTNKEVNVSVGMKRKLVVSHSFDEGCSQEKIPKTRCKMLISLDASGRCPICAHAVSPNNWSIHCQRNHEDFVLNNYFSVVREHEVVSFITNCTQNLGLENAHSILLAALLVYADKYGYYDKGLRSLSNYTIAISLGSINIYGTPNILNQNGATVYVDGQNTFGFVVANFCTAKSIQLAKYYGLGIVIANRSNDYGPGQYYAQTIARQGLLGIVYSTESDLSFGTKNLMLDIPTSNDNYKIIFDVICKAMAGVDCEEQELGQFFFAIDQNRFSENYNLIINSIMKNNNLNTLSSNALIRKNIYEEKYNKLEGFCYPNDFMEEMRILAGDSGCEPMKIKGD